MLVYIANLTHFCNGVASTEAIPLNIGYLASYLLYRFANRVEVFLFNEPEALEIALASRQPDVLATSNYSWSSNLNYLFLEYAKKLWPDIVTVMGGPNYPGIATKQKVFLKKHPALDFYVYLEGEQSFAGLVEVLLKKGKDLTLIQKEKPLGLHYMEKGVFVDTGLRRRITDLNVLPSPYLLGLFDEMLEKGYTPLIQTNRGCPFICAFCHSGSKYNSPVFKSPLERVKKEICYIGPRSKSSLLHIADSNYGLFKRDKDITEALVASQRLHGWPLKINISTSKIRKNQIYKAIKDLKESIYFSASVQSTNPDTLKAIHRTNMSFGEYANIIEKLAGNQVKSFSEFILGMPNETWQSHMDGIQEAVNSNIDQVGCYTCMLLPNTPLLENRAYAKYKIDAKWRVIPRDFGIYLDQKVIEVEQVCVATNTMTLQEYVNLRGFFFVVNGYHNMGLLMEISSYIKLCGNDIFSWLKALHGALIKDRSNAGDIYKNFLSETVKELWESEEELQAYFSREENYANLVNGDLGSNLIQKYSALFLDALDDFVRLAVDITVNQLGLSREVVRNLAEYCLGVRFDLFNMEASRRILDFDFDILKWIKTGMKGELQSYAKPSKLAFYHQPHQVELIRSLIHTYGKTVDSRGKILTRINPVQLFRRCEYE